MSNGQDDPLDFSADQRQSENTNFRMGDSDDPRPQEDTARRYIAYSLILILFVLISGILLLAATKCIDVEEIKVFSVVLGPIITLVSAATGFYYGTKVGT